MKPDLDALNTRYAPLSPEARVAALFGDFEKVLFTSSFGTTAAMLLHLFHRVRPELPVYFLDTTYHFAETLAYKTTLTELLQLHVIDVLPEDWKNKFTQEDHTWHKDPDLCCSINKVEPLERIRGDFDVWVSGLIGTQNKYRETLPVFEARNGIIKFYPLIDQQESIVRTYMQTHNLPEHPLLAAGFNSVGCYHCTTKGKGRAGRWSNKSKSECGLHL